MRNFAYISLLACMLAACQSGDKKASGKEPAELSSPVFTDDTVQAASSIPERKSATEVPDSTQVAPANTDWVGTYEGELPCADCQGIKTELILGSYGTYKITEVFQGKTAEPYSTQGSIKWIRNGLAFEMTAGGRAGQQYLLGDRMLYQLDKEGRIIKGKMAKKYTLKKVK